jgi:hypothetical protein
MEYSDGNSQSLSGDGSISFTVINNDEGRAVAYWESESSTTPYACESFGTGLYEADSGPMPIIEKFIGYMDVTGMKRILPNDMINGLESRHYRAEDVAFEEFTNATVDVWLARDPAYVPWRYVTKVEIDGDGTFSWFGAGSLHIVFQVDSIHQPIEFVRPASCAP